MTDIDDRFIDINIQIDNKRDLLFWKFNNDNGHTEDLEKVAAVQSKKNTDLVSCLEPRKSMWIH